MIIGLGRDLFDVPRTEEELRQYGSDAALRLFSPEEIAYSDRQRVPASHTHGPATASVFAESQHG